MPNFPLKPMFFGFIKNSTPKGGGAHGRRGGPVPAGHHDGRGAQARGGQRSAHAHLARQVRRGDTGANQGKTFYSTFMYSRNRV